LFTNKFSLTNIAKEIKFWLTVIIGVIMKQLAFLMLLTGLYIAGCANQYNEQALKDIKLQIAELDKKQAKTNTDIEELNSKFILLKEQVDISKKGVDDLKSMAVPVTPPEELKVVKLEAEETKPEPKKEPPLKEGPKKADYQPSPETLYNEAQNLFTGGKLAESVEQFAKFILYYPKHTLADNAQYWIGEAYYSEKNYQKAVSEFKKVVDNYPAGNKAPDALLKVAFSYLELNNREKALEFLRLLPERYPSSEAAAKAQTKLQELQK